MVRRLRFHEKKLLKKVDFISWEVDNNLHEVKILKKYYIQKREDYTKYNKLSRHVRELARKVKELDVKDPFRAEATSQLLEKLYNMGLVETKRGLELADNVNASSFCRRRLPVMMVKNHMAQTLKAATTFIEQGHIRVGPEVVKDPAFLVTRNMEDFVTWTDTSAIKKHVLDYNEMIRTDRFHLHLFAIEKYLWFYICPPRSNRFSDDLTLRENVTILLDNLLQTYDKSVRPAGRDGPLVIKTNMLVRSMGPITESEMTYSLQCYLRQSWHDERLKFDLPNVTEVTLSNTFLKDIWKPNTYFLNGRLSTQPNITVPNVFVRIRKDGSIYMSRRLTINAKCPMNLLDYPMDAPVCPLLLAGWTQSGLEVYFHLKRHIGFFMLQTYLPCTLIVCLSWVSFWINRDAAPARVLLGVTTILSTAAVGLIQRDGLPRVPYATALDVFLNVCIFYNLAAIIQYSAVNYFTKILPKEGGASDDEDETENVLNEDQNGVLDWNSTIGKETQTGCMILFCRCLLGNFRFRYNMVKSADAANGNSVSSIDILSRYIFPLSFCLFQAFYWAWYLRFKLS
uniref:U3 small nucleolar ribonucleoprotein protein IMP3 n=1 Tax=Magallana gigas TaxID=29159 RepID=K1PI24_MAGGI